MLLEEGVCYDQCFLLAKLYWSLPCFILYSKAKFACYSRYFLTFYFCIPVPYNEKDFFLILIKMQLMSNISVPYQVPQLVKNLFASAGDARDLGLKAGSGIIP